MLHAMSSAMLSCTAEYTLYILTYLRPGDTMLPASNVSVLQSFLSVLASDCWASYEVTPENEH